MDKQFVVSMDTIFKRLILCYFFFQAEDGIRDAQESRGLGDVYKRQVPGRHARRTCDGDRLGRGTVDNQPGAVDPEPAGAVSYTHLTLPTIYSV